MSLRWNYNLRLCYLNWCLFVHWDDFHDYDADTFKVFVCRAFWVHVKHTQPEESNSTVSWTDALKYLIHTIGVTRGLRWHRRPTYFTFTLDTMKFWKFQTFSISLYFLSGFSCLQELELDKLRYFLGLNQSSSTL